MKLKFFAEVSVYYNHTGVVEVPKPKFGMVYGCLFNHVGDAKFRLAGESEVSIKKQS